MKLTMEQATVALMDDEAMPLLKMLSNYSGGAHAYVAMVVTPRVHDGANCIIHGISTLGIPLNAAEDFAAGLRALADQIEQEVKDAQ